MRDGTIVSSPRASTSSLRRRAGLRVVTAAAVLGVLVSGAASCADGTPGETAEGTSFGRNAAAFGLDGAAGGPEALLSEILWNPPGDDAPWEFVEIACVPGAPLTDLSFVALEGDSGGLGIADLVVPLGSYTCGASGMLFLRVAADAGGHEGPADATQRLASFGMENGSATYALLKGGTLLVKGTDYDTDDDGTLELPGGVTIVDSLGVLDNNNAGDRAYGSAVLARSTGEMDGATRICTDRTPSSVTAWYGGKLPSGESSALVYDPTKVTANAPAGARLTPGAFGCVEPPDGGDAGDADAGDANDNDGADSDAATASLVRLSEIKVNPPKDDGPWEFIEIACTPSARLRDHSLVVIEGDSRVTGGPADGGADSGDAGDGGDGGDLDGGDAAVPTDVVGTADLVLNLDGVVCGSNGIVLLAKPGGHEAPAGAAAGTFPGSLENGTATFLLVKGAAGRITSGTDYDSNDDGTLELPAGTEIVDSVAIRDNEADARVYGPAVVGPNFTPDAVSRYCSEAANSGAAWLGGDLVGEPSSLAYDPARSTSNRPSGFLLTPGAPNPCGADGGTTGGATGSTTGSGGTSGGVTGATGGTTSPDGSTDGGDEVPTPGSCSCRAAGVETSRGWAGLAALLGGLAVLRRRRRRG